jgi:hypothetical protein
MTPKQRNIVKRWVNALRSGNYKKGTGSLRKVGKIKDSFCCLGVLCELAVKAKVIDAPYSNGQVGDEYKYKDCTGLLPQEVMDWAGLSGAYGSGSFYGSGGFDLKNGSHYDSLTQLNDGDDIKKLKAQSFKQIANLIEKQLTDRKKNEAGRLFV